MSEYEYRIVPVKSGTSWRYYIEYRDKVHVAMFPNSQLWTKVSEGGAYSHFTMIFSSREAARVWIDRDIAKNKPQPEEQIEYYPPKVMKRNSPEHET